MRRPRAGRRTGAVQSRLIAPGAAHAALEPNAAPISNWPLSESCRAYFLKSTFGVDCSAAAMSNVAISLFDGYMNARHQRPGMVVISVL